MVFIAIAGIIAISMFFGYFAGYKAGQYDARRKTGHKPWGCSCGAVTMRLSGLTDRNAGKVGLALGNTYHRVPPYVCHPIHEAVLGDQ